MATFTTVDSPAAATRGSSSESTTQQSTRLRAELKEWEKAFAAENGGRKAGRDDIKKNADIGNTSPSGITMAMKPQF